MSDNLSPEDAERFAHYEKLGEKQVRPLMSNGGLPPPSQPGVIRWLARKDQELARDQRRFPSGST